MFSLEMIRVRTSNPANLNPNYHLLFKYMERIEVIKMLKTMDRNFLMVDRVKWKCEPDIELVRGNPAVIEAAEMSTSGRESILLVLGRLPEQFGEIYVKFTMAFSLFIEYPATLMPDYTEGYVVGKRDNLQNFIGMMKDVGFDPRIMSRRKYYPQNIGISDLLTTKQLECVETAFDGGYFDLPRKKHTRDIAEKMGMSHVTFSEHIRKAEKTIVSSMLGKWD